MKSFTALFLLVNVLVLLSLAFADFTPYQGGNDDSDDENNIYKIRARRSAQIYREKKALEMGQEIPTDSSISAESTQRSSNSVHRRNYAMLSDDDDSDGDDGSFNVFKGDTSDDLSDAEPAVRARLRA